MRLIEDSPTRRIFEQRGKECVPPGPDGERATIEAFLVVVAYVALSFTYTGYQLILQGSSNGRNALLTAGSTLILLGCVRHWWRQWRRARNRVIRHVFDLSEKTLTIEDSAYPNDNTVIAPKDSRGFVIESVPEGYAVTILSGIYLRRPFLGLEPPSPEFIDALKMIGLQELDKLPNAN